MGQCVPLFDNHKVLWDSQTLTQLREVSLLLAPLLAQAQPEQVRQALDDRQSDAVAAPAAELC